jgi:hypothetical protein
VACLAILGIALDDIDYLDVCIRDGILRTEIGAIRDSPPYGINCVLDLSVRGLGAKSERAATVRTVWMVTDADAQPRLITAFIKVLHPVGSWSAGTRGTVVEERDGHKLVEISDDQGQMLDLVSVTDAQLRLISKHSD